MGIRANSNKKDHLRAESKPSLSVVITPARPSVDESLLRFETTHSKKPCVVDLTVFDTGELQRSAKGGMWAGPFKGRPGLIAELLPAIRDQLIPLSEKSVNKYMFSLRAWWRLFDAIETTGSSGGQVISTRQLTDLHRQCALDKGFDRQTFSNFVRLANTTRTALGKKTLYWQPPTDKTGTRHLPQTWQTDLIRHTLRHRWFAVLYRWQLAEKLREPKHSIPLEDEEQQRLQRNYLRFDHVVQSCGHPRPTVKTIWKGIARNFYTDGYSVADMMRGSYPDGNDIRAALHLCLATTGWNPAVFLSLDVTDNFVESHPKDPSRYILRGTKARAGDAEQVSEGLFKTQGSAGVILQTLVRRTAPLRAQLQRELESCLSQIQIPGQAPKALYELRVRVSALTQGVRSPWLFATQASSDIQWLTDNTFSLSVEKLTSSYLGDLIVNLNVRQPEGHKLSRITASDLRDAYAAKSYHASGGSILSVMKALGHRRPSTTQLYLNNTLLNEEHQKLYATFSTALWQEMERKARVDPTILAKISRDGTASAEERERLVTYRTILISRIGVGCRDPLHPPRHIAPNFVPDGIEMCHVQRCTLCLENAVILPESLPGLCKRLAELRYLRSHMSMGAFQVSSFLEELDNTELALLVFDATEVERALADWTLRISSGVHRVIEFDGIEQGAAP